MKKKHTNVDIIAELQKLVDSHVDSYKEDFDIDKRIIRCAAESKEPEDKVLMWFCRPHGTHCLRENQVFIQGTRDHNTYRFYAEQTSDECIARAEGSAQRQGVRRCVRGQLPRTGGECGAELCRTGS